MTTTTRPTPLITSRDAAELLGCSERLVRKLVRDNRISYVRIGRLVRFRPDEIDNYIDLNSAGATPTNSGSEG